MSGGIKLIVPSRGRPEQAIELAKAFMATRALETTSMMICIDETDPQAPRYWELHRKLPDHMRWYASVAQTPKRERMVPCLNRWANWHATNPDLPDHPQVTIIGFMGDDHLPRTAGWDAAISEALRYGEKAGVAYGNDLVHGPNIPTAAFVSAELIRKLGYMAPPGLIHMYADNFWKLLGEATSLHYLPNVVIEHLHPIVGKAQWSEQYAEVNGFMEPDRAEFERWLAQDWPTDRLKVTG